MLRKYFYLSLYITIIFTLSPSNFLYVQAEEDGDISVKEAIENEEGTVNSSETKAPNENITENEAEQEVPTFESQFSWFDFIKMIFALAVVIILIYVVLRFINQRNRGLGHARMIESLGGISLGTNRSIQLVKIGERIFIIGVGENIQLLEEIDSENEKRRLLQMRDAFMPGSQGILDMWLNKKNNTNVNEEKDDFRSMLKDQLETLSEGRKKVYDKYKGKEEK